MDRLHMGNFDLKPGQKSNYELQHCSVLQWLAIEVDLNLTPSGKQSFGVQLCVVHYIYAKRATGYRRDHILMLSEAILLSACQMSECAKLYPPLSYRKKDAETLHLYGCFFIQSSNKADAEVSNGAVLERETHLNVAANGTSTLQQTNTTSWDLGRLEHCQNGEDRCLPDEYSSENTWLMYSCFELTSSRLTCDSLSLECQTSSSLHCWHHLRLICRTSVFDLHCYCSKLNGIKKAQSLCSQGKLWLWYWYSITHWSLCLFVAMTLSFLWRSLM